MMGRYGVVELQIMGGYSLSLDNLQIWHGYQVDKTTCYTCCIHGLSILDLAVIHTPFLQEHHNLTELRNWNLTKHLPGL